MRADRVRTLTSPTPISPHGCDDREWHSHPSNRGLSDAQLQAMLSVAQSPALAANPGVPTT